MKLRNMGWDVDALLQHPHDNPRLFFHSPATREERRWRFREELLRDIRERQFVSLLLEHFAKMAALQRTSPFGFLGSGIYW